MNEDKTIGTTVRISLIDVLYGVVLGYGYRFFDEATTSLDYFRFFFTYSIIIVDWIYVHHRYWKAGYKYNILLAADILVIFIFSRLLYTSIANEGFHYWAWLSGLFLIYLIWDIFLNIKDVVVEFDSRYYISGDAFATIIFSLISVLLYREILTTTAWWHIVILIFSTVVVSSIAVGTWLKRTRKTPREE